MGDTSKYLVYVVNIGRSYASFGDVYYEIEFIEAYFGTLVISLRKVVILRIKVQDVKKTCW